MRPILLLIPLAAVLGGAGGSAQAASPVDPCDPVRVHFALDSSKLTAENRATLDRSAACLQANQQAKVSIQGNTDERGSSAYNQALGERRAKAVQSYLIEKGVSGAQLQPVSFGKDNRLCDQSDKECWQRNRRAAIMPYCHM
jgi:peptidoglycan-associated lipoprotein